MKKVGRMGYCFVVLCAGVGLAPRGPAASALLARGRPPVALPNAFPTPQNVTLIVTVLDDRGDPVTDLAPQDFQVFDDGKPQRIAYFQAGAARPVAETPLPTTVILFDLPNSSHPHAGIHIHPYHSCPGAIGNG